MTTQRIALPPPDREASMPLAAVLARRRSIRAFAARALTGAEFSQLLWAAQGETDVRDGLRSAPSAGALYPLEVYVATSEGVFRYAPEDRHLDVVSSVDARVALFEAALRQEPVRDAPAVFAVTAVFERTERKYGDRAVRYVHLEAGHAAQNLLLEATALGLAAVPIGAFDDNAVGAALESPQDHEPLYLIAVGVPE